MALKPCKECGKDVSTEANTCPNCGVPKPTKKVKKLKDIKISKLGMFVGYDSEKTSKK